MCSLVIRAGNLEDGYVFGATTFENYYLATFRFSAYRQ